MTDSLRHRAVIGADHPSLPGHFPGRPIVPGVVLLDEVRALAQSALKLGALRGMPMVKFVAPVLPGQAFEIRLQPAADGRVGFVVETAAGIAVQGSLQFDAK